MAIGDYQKTVYNNGQAPAINASNLNNNEDKTDELDKSFANHLDNVMPHQFSDGDKTYKWGLSVQNGIIMFNYVEVDE